VTVNHTNVILSLIEQQIPDRHFVHLVALKHAELEVVEASVTPDSPIAGQAVADIRLPPETNLIALLRSGELIIPNGQTLVEIGDEVIAVTRRRSEPALRQMIVNE
jgi:trk system potassium uptake protein TrkA